MRRLTAISLCAALLAACATDSGPYFGGPQPVIVNPSGPGPLPSRPGEPEVSYVCDDLTSVVVHPWQRSAVVTLNSGLALSLPALPSVGGFRFGGSAYEFRSRGNGAVWTMPDRAPVACRPKP